MAHTFVRVRIPSEIYKRFKIHCIDMDVSVPKQMTEFVRKFVEIQDQNKILIGK